MSVAAIEFSEQLISEAPARSHPVPTARRVDDSTAIMKRSAVISVALHIFLVAICVIINNWQPSGITGTPQEEIMNVTIVPLSALDTVLPKGAPQEQQLPAPVPEKQPEALEKARSITKPQPVKKIVAARSIASVKTAPTQASDSDAQATTSSIQPLGVSNGQAISLEQARISYQDMVATMLARAKRYPERALKRRMTGEGTIRIEITADGSLSDFQIVRSTDLPVLDEELRAMVERAAPFPAFPSDLRKQSLALLVPVTFRLQS